METGDGYSGGERERAGNVDRRGVGGVDLKGEGERRWLEVERVGAACLICPCGTAA